MLSALKGNYILGCTKRDVISKTTEVVLLHSGETPFGALHPALEPLWTCWTKFQRRITKMIGGLEHPSDEDRLRELKSFHLKKTLRRPYIHLPAPKGSYKKHRERLFTRPCSDTTKWNGFQLEESEFRLDSRNRFFTVMMARHWNRTAQKSCRCLIPGSIEGQIG